MFDFLIDLITVVARTLLQTLAEAVLPATSPAPAAATAGADALPNADALRAHFERLRRDEPPADWLARVRAATGPSVGAAGDGVRTSPQPPLVDQPPASVPLEANASARPAAPEPIAPQAAATSVPAAEAAPTPAPNASPVSETSPTESPAAPAAPAGEAAAPAQPSAGAAPAQPAAAAAPAPAPAPSPTGTAAPPLAVAAAPQPSGEHATSPTPEASPAASPRAAGDEPEFVREERLHNPNFGVAPARPHPIVDDVSALPMAPVHGSTVDAAAFAALHLADSTRHVALSPSDAALPFSPSRFGATSNVAHATAAPPHAAAVSSAAQPAPAATTEPENTWPALPAWPPAGAARTRTPRERNALRSRVRTSWYV